MIVPSQAFFVEQRPQQTQSASAVAQASAQVAQPTRRGIRRVAIEVDQGQAQRAHAGGLATGAHPHESIEHGDQHGRGGHNQDHRLAGGERAAHKIENAEKQSASDQDHAGVDGGGAGPVHGDGYGSVANDNGLDGGREFARRRRGGRQEIEQRLYVVGSAGAAAAQARGSAGNRFELRRRRRVEDAIEWEHFTGGPILEQHGLAWSPGRVRGLGNQRRMRRLFARRQRHGGQSPRGSHGVGIKLRPAATPAASFIV